MFHGKEPFSVRPATAPAESTGINLSKFPSRGRSVHDPKVMYGMAVTRQQPAGKLLSTNPPHTMSPKAVRRSQPGL